jgi:hypothetical protein
LFIVPLLNKGVEEYLEEIMGEAKRRKAADKGFGKSARNYKVRLLGNDAADFEQPLSELERKLNSPTDNPDKPALKDDEFILFLNNDGQGYPNAFCKAFQNWFVKNKGLFSFHPGGFIAIVAKEGHWYNLT